MVTRILVTGANGNAGFHTCLALVGGVFGGKVRACVAEKKRGMFMQRLAEESKKPKEELELQIEFAALDFYERSGFDSVVQDCDALFLVRPPPISNMKKTLIPFVECARKAGVERVVFVSVDGAENNTKIPHHAMEQHLIRHDGWYALLRPGFFAQNLEDAYWEDIVQDNRLIAPAGDASVNFIDLIDLGQVAVKLLLDPIAPSKQGLTLTGPNPVTFAHVAYELSKALERTIKYENVSVPKYFFHLVRHRHLAFMHATVQTFLHFRLRFGDGATKTTVVEQILGRPATSIETYISRRKAIWQKTKR